MSLTPSSVTRPMGVDTLTRRITNYVAHRFPEMRGVLPTRREGPLPGEEVFTFRTKLDLGAGRLTYVVRVVVDDQGRVVRTVTSH